MDSATQAALRGQLIEICSAVAFLMAGLTACAIAAIRRRNGVGVLLWTGVWSSSYGLMHLLGSTAVVAALPANLQRAPFYITTILAYLMLVIASFAWLDLIVGVLRRVVFVLVAGAIVTAILGIGYCLLTGAPNKFMGLNNFIAACLLVLLLLAISNQRLSQKYLRLRNRNVLVFGTFLFAVEALAANVLRPLGFSMPLIVDHLGFAVLIAAFGYSALRLVLENEHRLLAIDSELAVAREIQSSILPIDVPQVQGLEIAAVYEPAASVAGDFYEFLPVDATHSGIFLADVCGHGVPAALIASMLKVAVQSAAGCADSPGDFLAALNRTLSGPLRGKLVSAAYLWLDADRRIARYSAAGHPPLLRWSRGNLESVESNGLLFGVLPECDYPTTEFPLVPGERLLLYTDGVTDPENHRGVPFGDNALPDLLAHDGVAPASVLVQSILNAIPLWQSGTGQQDDITLVVVDVR